MLWGLFGCSVKGGSLLLSQPVVSRRTRVGACCVSVESSFGGGELRRWWCTPVGGLLFGLTVMFRFRCGFSSPSSLFDVEGGHPSMGVSLPQDGGSVPLSFVPRVGRRVPCSDLGCFR